MNADDTQAVYTVSLIICNHSWHS